MQPQRTRTKAAVIIRLYEMCVDRGDMTFDNGEVRRVCDEEGFGNPFDATKIDNSDGIPPLLARNDVLIVHLGRGRHQFVTGIGSGYHGFEPIPEEQHIPWRYRRSVLNNINTSESNILSVCYNQRVMHDFLYEDIAAAPKVYGSHRTHIPLEYRIGDVAIRATRLQVEIDFTMEYLGQITVFEAKNGSPPDFNVFQLFNPYRYYVRLQESLPIESVQCCYLLRQDDRLRLYLYSFDDREDPGSIRLLRNAEYRLLLR